MKKENVVELLNEWKNHYVKLSEMNDKIYDIFESPLPDVCWESFDLYTDTLSKLLNDNSEDTWLSWFAYENDMGTKEYDAGYDDIKPIKTIEDLADLIIEGAKR